MITFLFAGFESTYLSLCWTLFEMSKNPSTRQKLFAEVEAVLAGRTVAYEDIAKLSFSIELLMRRCAFILRFGLYRE